MSELNQKIKEWQNHLLQDQSLSIEDVEELKSHLKMSIDDLQESGLSEEEAFLIAQHRMGAVSSINAEFAKVNSAYVWRKRIIWLISGYFIVSSIPPVINLLILPIHYFQIDWLLFSSGFLFGPTVTTPYPLYLIFLLLLGGLLLSLMRKDSHIHSMIQTPSYTYKLIAGIVGGFIAFKLLNVAFFMLFSRISTITVIGNVSASQSVFSLVWNMFLVLAFVIAVSIQWRQRTVQLA